MRSKGFTLVEIMIVVAIVALLAAIAIPNLLRAKVAANDSLGRSTVRAISIACETFAGSNSGSYPGDIASLTGTIPAYLSSKFCGATISGYTYLCSLAATGYTITGTPVTIGGTGTTTVTVTTGGVFSPL